VNDIRARQNLSKSDKLYVLLYVDSFVYYREIYFHFSVYIFFSVFCFKTSCINIHVFHTKMKIYRSSICYCLQSFDVSGVNKNFLNRTRVECIYILQSTCFNTLEKLRRLNKSEKMTFQCYRNDFGKFFQH